MWGTNAAFVSIPCRGVVIRKTAFGQEVDGLVYVGEGFNPLSGRSYTKVNTKKKFYQEN